MMKRSFILFVLLLLTCWNVCPAEILPPHGEGQIGLQAVVLCESLTVRQKPATSAKAVKKLNYGDLIIVVNQSDGWSECFLSDSEDEGPAGWVISDYLIVDPAWYRTDEATPVYAWNETTAPKVALLDANTTLPILKADGEWLIVSLRGAAGWIHAEPAEPAALPAAGRQDGDRFEAVIMLEGMEETVRYEHVRNDALGIEMDYDYEQFERHSEADHERFFSRYDNPEDPLNYLEVRSSAEDADTVAASVREALSNDCKIISEPYTLDRAGSCIRIDASCAKDGKGTPDWLQVVYIIPAEDGCRVATVRCTFESAEGFGARISYMMNTLAVLDSAAE